MLRDVGSSHVTHTSWQRDDYLTINWALIIFYRVTNGGECLFQASDDEEMSQWVGAINQVAEAGASGSGSGRAQTLPAGQRSGDEPKKRSFFTLKKK